MSVQMNCSCPRCTLSATVRPGVVGLGRGKVAQRVGNVAPVNRFTGLERDLLALLTRGLTDDVIARELAVSVRTERRMVADLMKRLDASSRFEAGVKAAQRGWC